MDFGIIQGDNLRFVHQAFISDTISNALEVPDADVRLYYIDHADRRRLVQIVTEYLRKSRVGKKTDELTTRFSSYECKKERWGIRVGKVFQDCFAAGYQSVVVIGSRTPTITPTMMKTALKLLGQSDAVFGPTPDGRYYMLGMSGNYHFDLAGFDWTSPSIYSEVAEEFTRRELSWSELEIWYAVETTDDLEIMVRDINQLRFEGNEAVARETETIMERILAKLEP